MIRKMIQRPVLSAVVSIFIVLLGVLGLLNLPVSQYPDIAPPTIKISTKYIGANAETVMKSVIIPIEELVNGVENMDYITSSSNNNGDAYISVFFKPGTDPDIAAVNVQNRVARATPLLPSEVVRSGVITQKQQTDALMFISFYSTNNTYDDVFLQNYLDINVIPQVKRISGVGDAQVFGAKNYAMRIWIKPDKLKNFQLVPADIIRAINSQSLEAAPGQIGQNDGNSFEYVIKYIGKLNEISQYENIIVKTGENKQLVYLKDVANIELSALSSAALSRMNNNPSVMAAIYQTPGSNAQDVIKNTRVFLEKAKKDFPEGIDFKINYDVNEFLTASIDKVVVTLLEAFLLVFIVVFIFLQDFKSTLIPAIAVPVSIIGTFFFLSIFGFSINLLTLFALILAIGIVVDDAIVVVEAVHAKIESEKNEKNIEKITVKAMDGITTAIISITLVMAAVFVPVSFISGPTGAFYKEFGVTLMIAIAISAINALTLSPMLCALFLKPHSDNHRKKGFLQKFYDIFNIAFDYMIGRYGKVVKIIIHRKWIAFALIILSFLSVWWANKTIPTGFVPSEDRKVVFANVELSPGSSLDRTNEVMKNLTEKVKQIKGVDRVSYVSGMSLISGQGSNNGFGIISLKDWSKRDTEGSESVQNITKNMFDIAAQIPEAKMIFFSPPSVPGFGISSGFSVELLDKQGGSFKDLDEVSKQFMKKLFERPEIMYAQSGFNTNYPQYEMEIDVTQALQKGVSPSEILSSMGGYIGGIYAADFTKYGKQFRVMVQALPENRSNLESFKNIYVKNKVGEMIPVNQLVDFKRIYGPQSVSRFNLFNNTAITGASNPGYSSGDALKAVQEVASTELPKGYDIDFSGLSREEVNSSSQNIFIFLMSLIFVYLLLSAQYESFILPFAILISLPLGISGAYWAQKLAGLENNIFFQISLVMLIGLLAKNAILIVEFAMQKRRQGHSLGKSAIMGAKERMRPILMTSFAFILGLMPLVNATGVGAEGNRSLATGAAFGLLVGTFLGLLVIPAMYVVFQSIQEKIKPIKRT